jgi:hypothetical protein
VRGVLSAKDYEGAAFEELKSKIEKAWRKIIDQDLAELDQILRGEDWLFGDTL